MNRLLKPRVVITDGEGLHIVRSTTQAHWRYYRTYGIVVGHLQDGRLAIVVYGEIHMRYFRGVALQRVPLRPSQDWRREWTPERLKKRIRQHRQKVAA